MHRILYEPTVPALPSSELYKKLRGNTRGMSGIKPRHLIHALAENRAQFPRNPDVAYTIAAVEFNSTSQNDILCIVEQIFQQCTDGGGLFAMKMEVVLSIQVRINCEQWNRCAT